MKLQCGRIIGVMEDGTMLLCVKDDGHNRECYNPELIYSCQHPHLWNEIQPWVGWKE